MPPNLNRRIVQVIGIDRYIACHKPINISPHLKIIDGNPVKTSNLNVDELYNSTFMKK